MMPEAATPHPADALLARPALLVLGTGTGVGKTVASRAVAAAWRQRRAEVCAFKPVESGGTDRFEDAASHWDASTPAGRELLRRAGIAPGQPGAGFEPAIAPWTASLLAGRPLDYPAIVAQLRGLAQACAQGGVHFLAEGAGGVLVPLSAERTFADLAAGAGLPVLLVGMTELGTVNHTLLSLEALERRNVEVAGVVLSRHRRGDFTLAERAGLRELGVYLKVRVPCFLLAGYAEPDGIAALSEVPPFS